METRLSFEVGAETHTALLVRPPEATACLVLAHGAGAGMNHASMAAIADGLAARNLASLRYQFPYMEKNAKRTDSPSVCHATVRAAVTLAHTVAPGLPLIAGGRSFGGRMTSQAQALEPLAGVRGLVFFAFPLHPVGKPGIQRAEHLSQVRIPMLFLQGSNDALAGMDLLKPLVSGLGAEASLVTAVGADHSFHVPKRSGTTDAQILSALLDALSQWSAKL